MKKNLRILCLIILLTGCHQTMQISEPKVQPVKKVEFSEPRITDNFKVIDIAKIKDIDENSALLLVVFSDQKDNSKVAWLYLYNNKKKCKVFAAYKKFGTDEETVTIYTGRESINIDPVGRGIIKDNFVTWLCYDYGRDTIILRLTHRKNFNIETKEGTIKKIYEVNLTQLAKELWQAEENFKD